MKYFISTLTLIGLILFTHFTTVLAAEDPCDQAFGCFESPIDDAGITGSILAFIEGKSITFYVNAIVEIITAVIVLIGLIVIIGGGYVYMTAGGSAERVSLAKAMIGSALLGIVLSLAAVTILNVISPQFAEEAKEPVLPLEQRQQCHDGCFDKCGGNRACVDQCHLDCDKL